MAAPAQPAQPAQPADSPGWHEEAVACDGPEGLPLAGILCEPAVAAAGSQCALLCHGFASHKQGFCFPALAHALAARLGMSSLRFDYTGNMDSPGPFRFASFNEEVQQMAAAKAYLERQHGKEVVLLLGHSRGAINATIFTAQQQQQQPGRSSNTTIPLVVLVAGRYDLTLNMKQRYGDDVVTQLQDSGPWQQVTRRDGDRVPIPWTLTAEDMQARFATDIAGACAAISSNQPPEARPQVLVVRGGSDAICEASDSAQLAGAIAGAYVEVEGADHWFRGREAELLAAVEGFVLAAGRGVRVG